MRLFDHLASGHPVIATNACPQIQLFADHVSIAVDDEDFLGRVISALGLSLSNVGRDAMRECALQNTWSSRAVAFNKIVMQTNSG